MVVGMLWVTVEVILNRKKKEDETGDTSDEQQKKIRGEREI